MFIVVFFSSLLQLRSIIDVYSLLHLFISNPGGNQKNICVCLTKYGIWRWLLVDVIAAIKSAQSVPAQTVHSNWLQQSLLQLNKAMAFT